MNMWWKVFIGMGMIIFMGENIMAEEIRPQVYIIMLRGELRQANYEYGKLAEQYQTIKQELDRLRQWKQETDEKEQRQKELMAPSKQEAPQ